MASDSTRDEGKNASRHFWKKDGNDDDYAGKRMRCSKNFGKAVMKYGILVALIVCMFLTGLLFRQLSNRNPIVIPYPNWCKHSNLHLKFLEESLEAQKAAAATSTTTVQPLAPKKAGTSTAKPLQTTTVSTTRMTVTTTTTTTTTTTREVFSEHTVIPEYHNDESADLELRPGNVSALRTKLPDVVLPTKERVKKFQPYESIPYIPTMPAGLAEATAVFCFVWPLLPLLLNSRKNMNDAKLESIITHLLGQSSNFGIAEVFRTSIPLPEDLFLDKCSLSPEECMFLSTEKIALPLYLPKDGQSSSSSNLNIFLRWQQQQQQQQQNGTIYSRGLCRGQYGENQDTTFDDGQTIYKSLHHYPDAVCMLFGSSLVCFIASIYNWRRLNTINEKFTDASLAVRSIVVLSDICMLGSFLIYLVHLYMTYDMLQLLGVPVGVILQVAINRIISYETREEQENRRAHQHRRVPIVQFKKTTMEMSRCERGGDGKENDRRGGAPSATGKSTTASSAAERDSFLYGKVVVDTPSRL